MRRPRRHLGTSAIHSRAQLQRHQRRRAANSNLLLAGTRAPESPKGRTNPEPGEERTSPRPLERTANLLERRFSRAPEYSRRRLAPTAAERQLEPERRLQRSSRRAIPAKRADHPRSGAMQLPRELLPKLSSPEHPEMKTLVLPAGRPEEKSRDPSSRSPENRTKKPERLEATKGAGPGEFEEPAPSLRRKKPCQDQTGATQLTA